MKVERAIALEYLEKLLPKNKEREYILKAIELFEYFVHHSCIDYNVNPSLENKLIILKELSKSFLKFSKGTVPFLEPFKEKEANEVYLDVLKWFIEEVIVPIERYQEQDNKILFEMVYQMILDITDKMEQTKGVCNENDYDFIISSPCRMLKQ